METIDYQSCSVIEALLVRNPHDTELSKAKDETVTSSAPMNDSQRFALDKAHDLGRDDISAPDILSASPDQRAYRGASKYRVTDRNIKAIDHKNYYTIEGPKHIQPHPISLAG